MNLREQAAYNRGIALALFLFENGDAYESRNFVGEDEIPVFIQAPTLPMSTYTARGYLSFAEVPFHGFDNDALTQSIIALEALNITANSSIPNYGKPIVIHCWSTWTFQFPLIQKTYEEFHADHAKDIEACFEGLQVEFSTFRLSECECFAEMTLRWADD